MPAPFNTTSAADWEAAPPSARWLPAMAQISSAQLPASWRGFWSEKIASALLESGRTGRWTVLAPALEPLPMPDSAAAALAALDRWQGENLGAVFPSWPAFQGGLMLAVSYDLARACEPISSAAQADLPVPPIFAGFARECLVCDHQEKTVIAVVLAERSTAADLSLRHDTALARAQELLGAWEKQVVAPAPVFSAAPGATEKAAEEIVTARSFDEPAFCAAVRRIQKYIAAGDTYQVNLSLRQSFPLPAAPEQIYEALRQINPSPYMGLLRTPEFSLVCGSPELLVRTGADRIESRPIAGTRPRGGNAAADLAFLEELRAHPKEQAEHLMLVDLLRNDLGRVAARGSVRVDEFMAVEGYSHVMHLVSHISGALAHQPSVSEILRAIFPGGTITGAPKVRTMQIIEELEPVRRGFYTGALGWLALDGTLNLNILIRTLFAQNGLAHVQAGAGIVADSIPEREYHESLSKARALLRAAAVAGQVP